MKFVEIPNPPLEYTSNNAQANMALMRAINEIQFWEKMKELMPLVAIELVKNGVDFSKIKTK